MPNVTPTISISTAQTIPLLLGSIGIEELALAHLMNAEAEKLQFILGTLTPTRTSFSPTTVSLTDLLAVDASIQRTLRDVIKKEMLLEFKFENVLDLIPNLLLPQQTFNFTGAIQTTTVPIGATTARITAIGAKGGDSQGTAATGGLGASIEGTFSVTPGETLSILVGGAGNNSLAAAGGGGGSFVWRGNGFPALAIDPMNNLLIAAGGGGGATSSENGVIVSNGGNARTDSIGDPGKTAGAGGGGGGNTATGGAGGLAGGGGMAGVQGGNGFGGGGGGGGSDGLGDQGGGGGGGGGGFAGGGGGGGQLGLIVAGGGGGGSFNAGSNQNNMAGVGNGNGQVTISFFG